MPKGTKVKGGRRALFAEATRAALVEAATELFVERGFAGTALAEVAARADASRGAVYHHFEDKTALFEAVMERQGEQAVERIAGAAAGAQDPWGAALVALDAFLEHCSDRTYATIVWKEGPAALGWQRWRETEHRYGFGLTRELVRTLMAEGYVDEAPLEPLTRIVFAMIGEAGMQVAEAPTKKQQDQARAESGELLRRILEGIRVRPKD